MAQFRGQIPVAHKQEHSTSAVLLKKSLQRNSMYGGASFPESRSCLFHNPVFSIRLVLPRVFTLPGAIAMFPTGAPSI